MRYAVRTHCARTAHMHGAWYGERTARRRPSIYMHMHRYIHIYAMHIYMYMYAHGSSIRNIHPCQISQQYIGRSRATAVKGYTMPYIILYIIYPFIGCGAWRTHRTGRGGVHTACDPLPRNTVSCAWMGQPAPTVSNSTPVMLPRPTLHKYNWNRVVQVECLRYSVHTIQQIHRQLPAYLR